MKEMPFSKIIKSENPYVEVPDITLVNFALQQCQNPDASTKTALIDAFTGESYTYAELYANVKKVAFGLHQHGIKKGDVVSMVTVNCPAVVFAQFGILSIGAVLSSITTTNTSEEIEQQIQNSNTVAVVASEVYEEKIVQAIKLRQDSNVKHVFIIGTPQNSTHCEAFSNLLLVEGDVPKFEIDIDHDLILLIYSSGTTDRPKGIMHTNKTLVGSMSTFTDSINFGEAVPCIMPLHYISGMAQEIDALSRGVILITFTMFSLPLLFSTVEKFKVSVMFYNPSLPLSIWPRSEQCNLSSLKVIMTGGAPVSKIVETRLAMHLQKHCLTTADFGQLYASTEAILVAIRTNNNYGSSGKIVRGVDVKFEVINNLFSPQITSEFSIQHSGKIFVKSALLMKGYLNNMEKTNAVLSSDGWYETGDVGFIDDKTELFVLNRISELINFKGTIYFPLDWESAFITQDAVKDVAVVGKQDSSSGQIPIAFIILNEGYEPNKETVDFVVSGVNQLLPVKMHIENNNVTVVKSIPRTSAGKILRKNLATNT